MAAYLLKRIGHAVVVVWAVATVVFFVLRLVPGGPAAAILGSSYTPAAARALDQRLGLDRPLLAQYLSYVGHFVQLHLGDSAAGKGSVLSVLTGAFPATASLTLVALVMGVLMAVPLGVQAARRQGTRRQGVVVKALAGGMGLIGLSVPTFWLGIMLILAFGVKLHVLPVFGYDPLSDGMWPWLQHLLLPAFSLALWFAAPLVLITRSSMMETLGQPYVRTAVSKGLSNGVVLVKHALPNAMVSVLTMAGIETGLLLSGAVVTEVVFGINGVGRALVSAIEDRDYQVVQGVVLLISVIFVTVNILVDLMYLVLDPRLRLTGGDR